MRGRFGSHETAARCVRHTLLITQAVPHLHKQRGRALVARSNDAARLSRRRIKVGETVAHLSSSKMAKVQQSQKQQSTAKRIEVGETIAHLQEQAKLRGSKRISNSSKQQT